MFVREKLIELMNERNLNLSQVSKMCGIAYSTLRDLYTGKNKNPLANTLKKLSQGLNIDSDYFIGEDNSKTESSIDEKPSKLETLAAHFDGEDFTEEDLDDINKFIKYVISKKNK